MKRPLATVLVLLAAASGGAEPLSRAQAVSRALEKNPDILRSVADNDKLNGRAREARADALPEIADGLIYRNFLTVGVLCRDLKLKDPASGGSGRVKDNWIYIQEPEVEVGQDAGGSEAVGGSVMHRILRLDGGSTSCELLCQLLPSEARETRISETKAGLLLRGQGRPFGGAHRCPRGAA